MKKFLVLTLTGSLLLSSLSACSGNNAAETSAPANTTASESPAADASAAPAENAAEDSGTEESGTESAGGGANVTLSAPGEFPIVTEPAEMEVVMMDETYIGELQTNGFATWYQEKTGISVTYTEVPATGIAEKVNLMLASEGLPDAFIGTVQQSDVNGARGVYIALNDLIEKQGVETKKVFEEYPDSLPGMITSVDGNIYAMPNINACFHCAHNVRAFINMKWLDNLGLEVPNTTEEFREVLRAFRDGDPRGDGTKVIPMTAAGADGYQGYVYPFLLNSFVPFYFDKYTYLDESGTVQFVVNTEDFREGLRYIRSLAEEGLIDPLAFSQNNAQVKQLGSDPNGSMFGVAPANVWWQVLPEDSQDPLMRSREYDALSPLEGPKGFRNSPLTDFGLTPGMAVITRDAENPEMVFKWLDGLYNQEVTLHSQIGTEGVNWEAPPEGSLGINEKPALYIQHWYEADSGDNNERMDNIMMANRSSDFRLGEMADWNDPETQWAQEPRLYTLTEEHYIPYAHDEQAVPNVSYSEEEGARYNLIYTQLNDFIKENIMLFLAGSLDIENDWENYTAQLDALNWQEYVSLVQTAYDRQYK